MHHELLLLSRERLQLAEIITRLRQPFGVRPVGAHQQAVRTQQLLQTRDVVFVERRDPDVALERLDRVFGELLRANAVSAFEALDQPGHPVRSHLYGADAQAREAREQAVADQRGHRVEGRARAADYALPGRGLEGFDVAAFAPLGEVAAVAGIAAVERDRNACFGDARPERVEVRVGERARDAGQAHRRGAHHHEPHVAGERALELRDGVAEIHQGDVRRREDHLLVRIAPVFVQPLVEGVEGGRNSRRVVAQRFLHAHAERREEERALDALLLHHFHARVAVAVLDMDRLERAEGILDREAALVLALIIIVQATGPRDGIERGVRDEAVHGAAHQ